MPLIYVRSRVKGSTGWYNEWIHETRSWKKAWEIVRGCYAKKETVQKRICKSFLGKKHDVYFLDIGGVQEQKELDDVFLDYEYRKSSLDNISDVLKFHRRTHSDRK